MPTAALADLALHKPIRLSRAGSGASDSVLYSGVALSAKLLRGYAQGDAEVTQQARIDTARGLKGVKFVSPEDHQAWTKAHQRGEVYDETALGTVTDADYDAVNDRVLFQVAVHDKEAIRRIDAGEWPDVSVAYEADIAPTEHPDADFAQASRRVRHLAGVPRGRDHTAKTMRDAFADGAPMKRKTLAQALADASDPIKAKIAEAEALATADAVSYDKARPIIEEMIGDDVGLAFLMACIEGAKKNKPVEKVEAEEVVEDADPMKEKEKMMAASDAKIAALEERLIARLAPIEHARAATLAAADAAALSDRAAKLAVALNNAGIKHPADFDAGKPTMAACDAAQSALVDALQTPRALFGAPRTDGRRWTGNGRSTDTQTAADAAESIPLDEIA